MYTDTLSLTVLAEKIREIGTVEPTDPLVIVTKISSDMDNLPRAYQLVKQLLDQINTLPVDHT